MFFLLQGVFGKNTHEIVPGLALAKEQRQVGAGKGSATKLQAANYDHRNRPGSKMHLFNEAYTSNAMKLQAVMPSRAS